jgi:iron complex outermembrane recepter protein
MGYPRRRRRRRPSWVLLVTLLVAPGPLPAEDVQRPDLTRLSIEELAAMKVVSVSRRPEARLQAAGAVHVVTAEDIRRLAATTIPDALRLAPGVQASAIDANEWALTVRGFASRLSRSVQVRQDGRVLWTPLFAGVFWDAQDAVLDDLDRIEVVRGPGGALFGANALNGVINIISKDSGTTQGGLLSAALGTAERYANLRWGDGLGGSATYRVFARYLHRDGTRATSPAGYDDSWRMLRAGGRLDARAGERDTFTARGEVYDGRSRLRTVVASFTPPFAQERDGPVELRGGSLSAIWRHVFTGGSDGWLRAYYDEARRSEPYYGFTQQTVDVEAQHRFTWAQRHETSWGANYRVSHGVFRGSPTLQLLPPTRNDDLAGLFVHHESRLLRERLRVIAGSKLEWNDYSGWNLQPSARLAWTAPRHTVWGAATRAVRTSSRFERDIVLYTPLSSAQPQFARLQGNPDFEPETVITWEAGYKTQLVRSVLVDVTGFHSRYDRLATNEVGPPTREPGTPPEPPRVVVPIRIANGQEGSTSGVEVTGTASPAARWRVQASYSYLRVNQTPKPGTTDRSEAFEGNSPRHQLWAASYLALAPAVDLDLVFRRVARIPTHAVPAFSELDARLNWRASDGLQVAVAGKNLLHAHHPEFGGGFEVDRAVLVRASWEW